MEDKYLWMIKTMKPEQYQRYLKGLPIPFSVIQKNPQKFAQIIANDNELLEQLLNDFWKNHIQTTNVIEHEDCFIFHMNIALNNEVEKNFIKQLREKLALDHTQFNMKPVGNGIVQVAMSIDPLTGILDLKNMVDHYFVSKKNNASVAYDEPGGELFCQILNQYSAIASDVVEKLILENKNEVIQVKAQEEEQRNFINPAREKPYVVDEPLQDTINIEKIYRLDPIYHDIPFHSMTNDMKKTMCNRYFQMVLNEKINQLQKELSQHAKTNLLVLFYEQQQKGLGRDGITGNTMPFSDSKNLATITMSSYSDLTYFKIEDNQVMINEELLGQTILTLLHEFRHTEQQQALRSNLQNDPVIEAIKEFEKKREANKNYYEENYKNDPAELDANLYAFSVFQKIGAKYGIKNVEKVILDRTEEVSKANEDSYRIFDKRYTSCEEVMTFLNAKMKSVCCVSSHQDVTAKIQYEQQKKQEQQKKDMQEEKRKDSQASQSYLPKA